jgi:hypothetical protein
MPNEPISGKANEAAATTASFAFMHISAFEDFMGDFFTFAQKHATKN